MLKKIVCIAVICCVAYGDDKQQQPNLSSPCPGKFDYSLTNAEGSWDGTLTLNSEFPLFGLWIRVFFNRPIKSISSPDNFVDVHETIGEDNSFLLKNREYVLKKNTPTKVNFHVTYEGNEKPLLTHYRLNAREVCLPEKD